MKRIKASCLLSIAVFVLPVMITGIYKFTQNSIGPVVFIYSIAGGITLGILWAIILREKWGGWIGLLLGALLAVMGMVLLINFFIGVTWIMGEMDYHLM